jgi:hypothetical protein
MLWLHEVSVHDSVVLQIRNHNKPDQNYWSVLKKNSLFLLDYLENLSFRNNLLEGVWRVYA